MIQAFSSGRHWPKQCHLRLSAAFCSGVINGNTGATEQALDCGSLWSGINAVPWDDVGAISEEMRKVIPVVKENGGCIFSSGHSAPSSVSLANLEILWN